MIKQLVYQKLKNLRSSEILSYAEEYNFSLTKAEAKSIVNYFKNTSFDPFSKSDQRIFFSQLANMTNSHTAQKAEQLFNSLIRKYNLTYLFED